MPSPEELAALKDEVNDLRFNLNRHAPTIRALIEEREVLLNKRIPERWDHPYGACGSARDPQLCSHCEAKAAGRREAFAEVRAHIEWYLRAFGADRLNSTVGKLAQWLDAKMKECGK